VESWTPCGLHIDCLNFGVPLGEIPCGVHMECKVLELYVAELVIVSPVN
jgi:hypothetical protein